MVAALLGLLDPMGGCSKPCDEDGLRAASQALEDRSPEGRRLGLNALGQACPGMPSGLRMGLVAAYGETAADLRASMYAKRAADETLAKLFKRTCPRTEAERDQALEAEDRAAATRQTCRLDRFGVLEPNELFVTRDLDAFLLYQWLTASRIDEALARTVARNLMAVGAGDQELKALCYDNGSGCAVLFARAGVRLARSTVDAPLRESVELRVSPTEVAVEGEHVLTLSEGRPSDSAFDHHVAEPVRLAMLRHARTARERADRNQEEWHHRLSLVADASVPFGTIADALFSARKAGYDEFGFVVGSQHQGAAVVYVSPPLAWFEFDLSPTRKAGPLQLSFVVHATDVQVRATDVDETLHVDAVAQRVAALKKQFPHETVATFRVDPDVSLQRLVALIDTVRGENCLLGAMGDQVPAACLFWQTIVDTNPSLYFNVDVAHTFALGEAKVLRSKVLRSKVLRSARVPSGEGLLARYEKARASIRTCLAAEPEFMARLRTRDLISVDIGVSPTDSKQVVGLVRPAERWPDTIEKRCILTPLGIETMAPRSRDHIDLATSVVIPVHFDVAPSPDTTGPSGPAKSQ